MEGLDLRVLAECVAHLGGEALFGVDVEQRERGRAREPGRPLEDDGRAEQRGDGIEPGPAEVAAAEERDDRERGGERVGDHVQQRGAVDRVVVLVVMRRVIVMIVAVEIVEAVIVIVAIAVTAVTVVKMDMKLKSVKTMFYCR